MSLAFACRATGCLCLNHDWNKSVARLIFKSQVECNASKETWGTDAVKVKLAAERSRGEMLAGVIAVTTVWAEVGRTYVMSHL